MSNNDIYFKVAKVISQQLDIESDKLNLNDKLNDIADSLDQIEILMNVEELFNVEISDEQSDKISCIQDLVNCIENNLK